MVASATVCETLVDATRAGNLRIGRVTMQREGGDAGRETTKMLQFKNGSRSNVELKTVAVSLGSTKLCGWNAKFAFEGAVKRGLRAITHTKCDFRHTLIG